MKRQQAKDIPDLLFLQVVERVQRRRLSGPDDKYVYSTGDYNGHPWAMIGDVQDELAEFHPKVVMAKFRQMERRGLVDGCSCGCRGDLQVTIAGRDYGKGDTLPH